MNNPNITPDTGLDPRTKLLFEETLEGKNLNTDLLIITAVPVELEAVLARLKPLPSQSRILKINEKHAVYYAGLFGSTRAVVAMCSAGSGGRDGSQAAASRAIRYFEPVAVVMVGIAFGTNPKKTAIGDVLVSDHVVPYEPQRKGAARDISRGVPAKSGKTLLSRFKTKIGWQFEKPDGTRAKFHIGPLLSGEKLVDNIDFRSELQEIAPEALGGEMEAWGLFSAADNEDIEWIVVKGICDWADGNKEKSHQPLAAAAAVDLALEVFSDRTALLAIGGKPNTGHERPPSDRYAIAFAAAVLMLMIGLVALSVRWQLGYFPKWQDVFPPKPSETAPIWPETQRPATPTPSAVSSPVTTTTQKQTPTQGGPVYCHVKAFNPEAARKPIVGIYFRGDLVIRNRSKRSVEITRLSIGLADNQFRWVKWVDQRPATDAKPVVLQPNEAQTVSFETSIVDAAQWIELIARGKRLNDGEKFILPTAMAIKTNDGRERIGFLELGELEVLPTGDIVSWATNPAEFSLIPGAAPNVVAQLPKDF